AHFPSLPALPTGRSSDLMSADADGIESVQAGFLAAFAAAVAQDAVVAENEHVGDELFVVLVLLGFGPVQIQDVLGGGDDGQVLRSEEHTSELQSPDHLVC